ncbi:MAG TPA: hypothetical protein VK116_17805 [Planctomycetota bacterium]|nr:hypothetical protein [Planctomycetota bacterium]
MKPLRDGPRAGGMPRLEQTDGAHSIFDGFVELTDFASRACEVLVEISIVSPEVGEARERVLRCGRLAEPIVRDREGAEGAIPIMRFLGEEARPMGVTA